MKILELIEEAHAAGARLHRCCHELGLSPRTIQRWRAQDVGDDRRFGPKTDPSNKLSATERRRVLEIANSAEFRDMSPKQIVPTLADREVYVASESTFYRVLREENQLAHRGRAKPPVSQPPAEHVATGPRQVWSWDITYLRGPITGMFLYLYLFVDVWSRKIVAFSVEGSECSELASQLLIQACGDEDVDPDGLVIHNDNGGPMKGATFKATMEQLGVIPSLSRPRVSDDNPFSEALFRTLKYCPAYPSKPFESLEAARAWVQAFVAWYNEVHLHSAIGFVTPSDRHEQRSDAILEHRQAVYEEARRRHPERWSGNTRAWKAPREVFLNPSPETRLQLQHAIAA